MSSSLQIQNPGPEWRVQTRHTRLSEEEGDQAHEGAQCGEAHDQIIMIDESYVMMRLFSGDNNRSDGDQRVSGG